MTNEKLGFNFFVITDVDPNSMVGNSTCLAASDFMVGFCVIIEGPYSLWCSFMFGWWDFHLDLAWVHIAPLSFPHGNKKLLVLSHLSLSLHTQINGKFKDADDITTYFRANTLHYLLHGCHHKHPMDGLRLVFPPAATTILSVPVSSKNAYLCDYPPQICMIIMCLLLYFIWGNSFCCSLHSLMLWINAMHCFMEPPKTLVLYPISLSELHCHMVLKEKP